MDKTRNKIIAENIRRYIREANINQKMLAEAIGIKPSTLSDYLNLRSNPSHGVIQKMADYFGILKSDIDSTFKEETKNSITTIYNQLDPPRQTEVYEFAEQKLEEQNNILKFPDVVEEETRSIITNRRSAAGNMIEVDDELANIEVIPASMVPKGADELVEITGASMEPLIKQGSEVYIRHQQSVENGEIAIVRIENEGVTCKRFYHEGDTIRLKSENEEYQDMYFDPSQVSVLGKVLL